MVLTKPQKAKNTAGRWRLLPVFFFTRMFSSPTRPPSKVPHVSEMGRSWREELDGGGGRTCHHHYKKGPLQRRRLLFFFFLLMNVAAEE